METIREGLFDRVLGLGCAHLPVDSCYVCPGAILFDWMCATLGKGHAYLHRPCLVQALDFRIEGLRRTAGCLCWDFGDVACTVHVREPAFHSDMHR